MRRHLPATSAALAAVALGLVFAAPTAQGASQVTNCAGLQAALTQATGNDVITLTEMCTGQSFTLPVRAFDFSQQITLQGQTQAAGFDGTGAPSRPLTGDNTGSVRITNLTFRDGQAPSGDPMGGAISITGASFPFIDNNVFTSNQASSRGGAIHYASATAGTDGSTVTIRQNTFGSKTTPDLRNVAAFGGAVSVRTRNDANVSENVFANNHALLVGGGLHFEAIGAETARAYVDGNDFTANVSGAVGGGAYYKALETYIQNSTYEGNVIEPFVFPGGEGPSTGTPVHLGAGAAVDGGTAPTQHDNVFRDNEIKPLPGGGEAIYSGAGMWSSATGVNSEEDQFIRNKLPSRGPDADGESEGAGLSWHPTTGTGSTFRAYNLVAAGNTAGADSSGAGIYVGSDCNPSCASLDLIHATVAGNSVGAGGANSGIDGGGDDSLRLRNSIVQGNGGSSTEIGDFASLSVDYTDACQSPGVPYAIGGGNICADAKLVAPAAGDVHQTAASPTIDKGENDTFDEAGEVCCDYEGDDRTPAGGRRPVDMGADEAGTFTQAPVNTPAPIQNQVTKPACADGTDNDGDGTSDAQDPGCLSGPNGAYNSADTNEADESARDLVLCGRRDISLVRADAVGKRVVLSGLVSTKLAGKSVGIFANLGKGAKKIATVKPDAAGAFTARVARPSKKLFAKARYSARVDKVKSIELKLPQSLASTSVKQVGGQLELRGQVQRNLLGKRNPVVVRRLVCGRYQNVGSAKPDKKGRYVVKFNAPALAGQALYRAETSVLAKPGSKRYVKQFARAIGIAVTGATG